jgi:hypothetical protein
MRFITRDGLPLEGETASDIIDALRADSRHPGRDRTEFLGILTKGAKLQTGAKISARDCETVLAGLTDAGLLERIH